MNLFVVGSGKLAKAILDAGIHIGACASQPWDSQSQYTTERAVVVHAGSGRQLDECTSFCGRTGSILVELSTGLPTESMSPSFPLILCPNTSILVLKMMHLLKTQGQLFEHYSIAITESHQSSKATEPGTAYSFADSLRVPHSAVASVRDPHEQLHRIGIPPRFVDKHAYHRIAITDGSDEICFETKVLGHDSYSRGVQRIVDAVVQCEWDNKRYSVLDLIDRQLL